MPFPPGTPVLPGGALVSLEDVKGELRISSSQTDDAITRYIQVATGLIEGQIGPVVPRSYTETVNLSPTIVLQRAPVITVDSLAPVYPQDGMFYNQGYTFNVSDYQLDAAKGILRRIPKYGYAGNYGGVNFPGYGFSGLITVTYTAGMTSVPAALQQSAVEIVREMMHTQRGPMPVAGASNEEALTGRPAIPAIVWELLTPYMRGDAFA